MSLKRCCRELLVDLVLKRALHLVKDDADASGPRLQVVVDEPAMRVLNTLLRMGDLHAEGVTSLELLERPRESLPDLDVLYILAATASNVELVLNDYRQGAPPRHRHVHLAFTQPLAPDLMGKLAESPQLAPRVKSIVEVPLTFLLVQDSGFHFNQTNVLNSLFTSPEATIIAGFARQLTDVCRCLQATSPTIRHFDSDLARSVAQKVQAELIANPAPRGATSVRCELLVLDRSIDVACSLVHEYTYECMVYDLLDGYGFAADGSIVTLPNRETLLCDGDPMWEELRHLHIQQAQAKVHAHVENAQRLSPGKSTEMSTGQMLEMLRKTPEQKEFIDRLQVHLFLNEQINARLTADCITTVVGPLEQDIACGIDQHGKDVKIANLQTVLSRALGEANLSSEAKLRLLLLYYASVTNISEVVRQRLMELAHLDPDDQYVLMGMLKTGLIDVPASQRHKQDKGTNMVHRVTKEMAVRFKKNARTEDRFVLSRFEPRMREILERLVQSRLSEDDFAVLGGSEPPFDASVGGLREAAFAPCAPTQGDTWSFAGACGDDADAPVEITRRYIIFVLGGIAHSELRVAAEVAAGLPKGVELVIGGTAVLTPKRVIAALRPPSNPFAGEHGDADPLDLA